MKTGKTLVELATEIQRQNVTKRDLLVSTSALKMMPNSGEDNYLTIHDPDGRRDERFGITDIAHKQIGNVLGIPAKYYDKMQRENPALLSINVNSWFQKDPTVRMVRTLDGNARAFLSEKYRRIDNYEVAQTVLPIIGRMEGANVESCELTESKMYIKVVNPKITAEVAKGDVVQAGIMITNSEVGQGCVNVSPLIYRLVCTNGMVAADMSLRKYHVGRINESGDNYDIYRNETIEADDRAFMMKIEDTVNAAVDQAKFESIVSRMRDAKDAKMDYRAVSQVVELTAKEFYLTKDEGDGVLGHLINGGDLSLYGLANAVTKQSQEVESYDRATDLEVTGWRIMTMAPSLWTAMNNVTR